MQRVIARLAVEGDEIALEARGNRKRVVVARSLQGTDQHVVPGPRGAVGKGDRLDGAGAVERADDAHPTAFVVDPQFDVAADLHDADIGRCDSSSKFQAIAAVEIGHGVAAVAAREVVDVRADAAGQLIVALATFEHIRVGGEAAVAVTGDDVIAGAARHDVAAAAADHDVAAFLASDQVVAEAAVDHVVVGAAGQPVVAAEAADDVVAAIAVNAVVEGAAVEDVADIVVIDADRIVDRDRNAVEIGRGQRRGVDVKQAHQLLVGP